MKWVLRDPVTSTSWTMTRNPSQMQTPVLPHKTQTYPGGLAIRAGDMPTSWTFDGKVRTKVEYDTLLAWSRKPNAIQITDHLGRIHEVMPVQFDPVPRRSQYTVSWRFDYTFRTLYLRRVSA